MTSRRRQAMAQTPVAAALLALTALITLGPATPASAHDELIVTSPAAGSEVSRAPAETKLTFAEAVEPQGSAIVVKDADGTRFDEPNTFAVSGNIAAVQLNAEAAAGVYTVVYRIVSTDGHVVSDSFDYTVTDNASVFHSPGNNQTPDTGTNTPANGTDSSEDSGGSVVWVLGLGAIGIVLIAAIISVAVRGRRDRSD